MENIYESSKILSEYLLFHYGTQLEILNPKINWPAGMADALDFAVRTPAHFTNPAGGEGLDLGCAVGRSTYEMSRTCARVTGMDYSHAFIDAATALGRGESLPYQRLDEAHLSTPLTARLPVGIDPEKTLFFQGDAMKLAENLGTFDRVHAANLLCRLTDPLLLLHRLRSLLNPGGQLVIATPCTWLEEFTPPANWPENETLEWLKAHLSADLELLKVTEEPFLIRETARKFQWTRSQLTLWQRRA